MHVGILGGTGPAGRGVAVRLAEAGIRVTLGSRNAERAATVASEVVARWPDSDLELGGAARRTDTRRTHLRSLELRLSYAVFRRRRRRFFHDSAR